MPTSDDGRVPSLGHLRELVITQLRVIPLLANVSRRLLDDLVATVGIETAVPIGVQAEISGREPVVLIVLERPVMIHFTKRGESIRLLPGSYLRDNPEFRGVMLETTDWDNSEVQSADDDRSRVFLIDRRTFEDLPSVVVHALDFDELEKLKDKFSL
jgi:hypothetical protein